MVVGERHRILRRAVDGMPRPTSLAQQGSLCFPREREAIGRRVRHKPDTWRSGQTRRKHAIRKQRGFPHVHCAAVNNRSRDNGSACFSPRTHHPSGRASFEADARRKGASLAAKQAETSSASLTDTRGVLPRVQPPQDQHSARSFAFRAFPPRCLALPVHRDASAICQRRSKNRPVCGVDVGHDAPRPARRRWPGFRSRGGRGFQEALMISPVSGSAATASSSEGWAARRRRAFDCFSR